MKSVLKVTAFLISFLLITSSFRGVSTSYHSAVESSTESICHQIDQSHEVASLVAASNLKFQNPPVCGLSPKQFAYFRELTLHRDFVKFSSAAILRCSADYLINSLFTKAP